MNNDVLTEILLHLPVQCLLRFRTVCKYWCRVIDSPLFQKLHNRNNNCKSEDTIVLHVIFSCNGIRVQHNRQSLISYETAYFNDFHGPVNGLICFNHSYSRGAIAICNPFLGQFMNLPSFTPCSNSSCEISKCSAAVGYDDEDYKVVQLLECKTHGSLHAHVYSRKTGAWKELAGDACVVLDSMQLYPDVSPMKSACKNGYFAHWHVYGRTMHIDHGLNYNRLILSFNMRNEVFQTVDGCDARYFNSRYFAEDEHSFLCFNFHPKYENCVQIYKSSFEGKKLSWNRAMHVEVPSHEIPPRWSIGFTGCVFFKVYKDVFVYDYRARKFICMTHKKNISLSQHCDEEIFECRGSFVSLM